MLNFLIAFSLAGIFSYISLRYTLHNYWVVFFRGVAEGNVLNHVPPTVKNNYYVIARTPAVVLVCWIIFSICAYLLWRFSFLTPSKILYFVALGLPLGMNLYINAGMDWSEAADTYLARTHDFLEFSEFYTMNYLRESHGKYIEALGAFNICKAVDYFYYILILFGIINFSNCFIL